MQFSNEEAQQAFDQIDALEVDDVAVAAAVAPGAATTSVQGKVCAVYTQARPLLLLLVTLFFIPDKWKNTIRTFTQTMDLLCTGGVTAARDVSTLGNVNKV